MIQSVQRNVSVNNRDKILVKTKKLRVVVVVVVVVVVDEVRCQARTRLLLMEN